VSAFSEDLLAARFALLASEPLEGDWLDVQRRARRGGRRRTLTLLVAAALAVIVVGSALAFGHRIVDFFAADPAPTRVVTQFEQAKLSAKFLGATNLPMNPSEARTIIDVKRADGSSAYIAVAPMRRGGFCALTSEFGSDGAGGEGSMCADPEQARTNPIMPGGTDSGGTGYGDFAGYITRIDADRLVLRYEDGAEDEIPVVWVSEPINAGFFAFNPAPEHFGEGHRAEVFVALDAKGHELARNRVLFSAPVAAPAPAPSMPIVSSGLADWEITDLGTLGGAATNPTAINDRGQVVGVSCVVDGCLLDDRDGKSINVAHNGTGVSSGFLWQSGKMRKLAGPRGGTATPYSLDERGRVVGESQQGAFVWQGGDSRRLGPLREGASTAAYAINDRGRIVGAQSNSSAGPFGTTHAFLWEAGRKRDLGTLGGHIGLATAINERGQVVGWSCLANERCAPFPDIPSPPAHAFLWEKGKMRDLGTLGGSGSYAYAINERGQVVGESTPTNVEDSGLSAHAFLWEKGTMRDLGTLGGTYSVAYGINDEGAVVGQSSTKNGRWHAFVWKDGVMTDLQANSPKAFVGNAVGINNRGQIVGSVADRSKPCGAVCEMHGVIWTPKEKRTTEDASSARAAPEVAMLTPSSGRQGQRGETR
jgi:probable HAF family extracellular repeat protein